MASITGTQSEKNFLTFSGESQARNCYTFFTSLVEKARYEWISSEVVKK